MSQFCLLGVAYFIYIRYLSTENVQILRTLNQRHRVEVYYFGTEQSLSLAIQVLLQHIAMFQFVLSLGKVMWTSDIAPDLKLRQRQRLKGTMRVISRITGLKKHTWNALLIGKIYLL